jgi:hypothetical protein
MKIKLFSDPSIGIKCWGFVESEEYHRNKHAVRILHRGFFKIHEAITLKQNLVIYSEQKVQLLPLCLRVFKILTPEYFL